MDFLVTKALLFLYVEFTRCKRHFTVAFVQGWYNFPMTFARRTMMCMALGTLMSGCGYATKGYRLEGVGLLPRDKNCAMELFFAPPKEEIRRVGVVEFKPRKMGHLPRSQEEVLVEAHGYVCETGGNALLVMKNGYGQYTRATILHLTDEQ